MESLKWIDEHLDKLREQDLLRELPQPLRKQGSLVKQQDRELINFASNDYLGLASDPRLIQSAINICQEHGLGRGASPLVSGRSELHQELELRLAKFMQTESALLFSSSFAANIGVIPALVDRGDAIYGDAKNHASIIDGCQLSHAKRFSYPHCKMEALEEKLQRSSSFRRRLIVTDTLFSMDGDLAPLKELAELARRYDAMLMLDETHAIGVFGEQGRGVAEYLGIQADIIVGTFGKAFGSAGGFVCGSNSLIQWFANRARSFVFSTAHPAAVSAAALAALDIVEHDPQKRILLLQRASQFRKRLQSQGWDTGQSCSQIIPIRVGNPEQAIQISASLREQGILLPGIRPPSVPPGESLLRIGYTAEHTQAMAEKLLSALEIEKK